MIHGTVVGLQARNAIADLPTTEKLVEVCSKLFPVIIKFFGLP
ncbi:MAG: hypothetical protein V7L04_13255 [Nostoc sp.]